MAIEAITQPKSQVLPKPQNIEKHVPENDRKAEIEKDKLFEIKNENNKNQAPKSGFREFFEDKLVTFTTTVSAGLNMLSAPVRLFDDNNPLKKIINKVSMFFTKVHLLAYSLVGMHAAHGQKNPLYLFSNFIEGLAAVLGLRNIYLFRGIATGIDGMVIGIKDKDKKVDYDSYLEGWKHSSSVIKDVFKQVFHKLVNDPLSLRKINGNDLAIVSSAFASIGGLFGMTVHEKSGATLRDFAGVGGDYGIFSLDNPDAKKSGFFYLAGSILDYTARIFNRGVASLLGISNVDGFERLKDLFFEAAIGFDKIGGLFFLRYNQKSEDGIQQKSSESKSEPKKVKPKGSFDTNRKNNLHSTLAA